jgi:hypothetical protein
MSQDFGDGLGVVGAWSGWSAVADVGGAGCGSGVLDEELALAVGDGDRVAGLVAVGDDEDVLEAVLGADQVLGLVEVERAGAGRCGRAGLSVPARGWVGAGWRDGGSGHGWGGAPRPSRWPPMRQGCDAAG